MVSAADTDCPLTRRGTRSLRPPIFPRKFPVWHGQWARQRIQGAIQAGIGWERWRHFRTIFGRVRGLLSDSRSGLEAGDFSRCFFGFAQTGGEFGCQDGSSLTLPVVFREPGFQKQGSQGAFGQAVRPVDLLSGLASLDQWKEAVGCRVGCFEWLRIPQC